MKTIITCSHLFYSENIKKHNYISKTVKDRNTAFSSFTSCSPWLVNLLDRHHIVCASPHLLNWIIIQILPFSIKKIWVDSSGWRRAWSYKTKERNRWDYQWLNIGYPSALAFNLPSWYKNSLSSNNNIKAPRNIHQCEVSSQIYSWRSSHCCRILKLHARSPSGISTYLPLRCFKISLFKTPPLTSNLFPFI